MSRWRRPAAIAGVVLLVAAAVVVAGLAIDVLRVDRQVASSDVQFTSRLDRSTTWTPETILPAGVARGILGIEDDLVSPRGAAVLAEQPESAAARVRGRHAAGRRRAGARGARRGLGQRRATLAPRHHARRPAARGSAQHALAARGLRSPGIEQFQTAITFDPTNDDAVHNLELSLKLLRQTGQGEGGETEGRSPLPSPGAGAATSGGASDRMSLSFLSPLAAVAGLVGGLALLALRSSRVALRV